MKIICLPYGNPHFYLKPDTAILRNGRTFYTPEVCAGISGALALVVRINRLGRHITPRFAYRYYSDTALGFCIYASDLLEQNRLHGFSWAPACALDYSAPFSECFSPVLESNPAQELFKWEQWSGSLTGSIDQIVSDISNYIFMRMGDLIWMELHAPLPLSAPLEVHASRNGKEELNFHVR
jgi:2-keto-4-pentenoate hydratase/2-oxohepta-3-ene-1,7-dioic acid hydratase in catechol pathway